jgi:formate hydrogenlyase transcriptional activator
MAQAERYGAANIPRMKPDVPDFLLRAQDMLAEATMQIYKILAVSHNVTSDMIWSVDSKDFSLLTFNHGFYEHLLHQRGIHTETGMCPEDLSPDEECTQRWRSFYRRAMKEGSFTTEYPVCGGDRTLRLNFNTLQKDDRAFGISVFSQDITELKVMEKKLQEQLAEIERLKLQLEKVNVYLREEIKSERGFGKIIGSSDDLQYVLFRARQVAATDATVLILGETGVGKGMVAHAIHEMSARRDKPMITVNCAALPANLIESELFGREKGAFTGAHARQAGRFDVADGGTIFLDEVGEVPLELQAKLLRVLQDGEFERLGSPRTISVDVRVIASTSRDLKAEMRNGRFREDLYYRLNVFPVSIPPLRGRIDDISELAEHFIQKYARKYGRRFETTVNDALQILQAYHWPGNVRELEHVIERAVITSPEPVFRLLDRLEREPVGVEGGAPEDSEGKPNDFDAMAREHIQQVLQKTHWKIEGKNGAAAILRLNPSTLRFRIKKLGIERPWEIAHP